MAPTVLIAGAAGNIGGKLRRHFSALGWNLRLLDTTGGDGVEACDLSVWDDAWAARFSDVDAVILLAGDPRPEAPWASIVRLNLDLVLNVYEAAARSRVRRVVFASSNWTMAGHRFDDGDLPTDRDPRPVNAYGMSKLAGERIGKSFADRHGVSSINFRIGWCQRGENRPGSHMNWADWGQGMWLSDRDMAQGFEKAVLAPDNVRFAVLNLMSDNPGMRWDIETTRRTIGYAPQDGAAPVPTQTQQDGAALTRRTVAMIEAAKDWVRDTKW
jgi:NAD+ dependent glucose-6-phosphate dehydrogenase